MKIATLSHKRRPTVAIVDPDKQMYWPLAAAYPDLDLESSDDMVGAIETIASTSTPPVLNGGGHEFDAAKLLAPIRRPPQNVLCVGKNYNAHAHEFTKSGFDAGAKPEDAIPAHPIIFTKPSSSISGPFANIPLWPGLDQAVDYEGELAVVIGKAGRFIKREDAMNHVFGYTIMNDVTARDLQKEHKQWFLGKGIDGFGPMGPWIVTRDELDISDIKLSCRVNGETRQDTSTRDLIFDVPTLIETISRSVTLSVGDIIATGTPAGVGIGFDPPRFLKDGDVVEVQIEGIGTIRNVVARA